MEINIITATNQKWWLFPCDHVTKSEDFTPPKRREEMFFPKSSTHQRSQVPIVAVSP